MAGSRQVKIASTAPHTIADSASKMNGPPDSTTSPIEMGVGESCRSGRVVMAIHSSLR